MSQHTRRQFIGSVGSAAVTTVLAPGGARRRPPGARGGALRTGRARRPHPPPTTHTNRRSTSGAWPRARLRRSPPISSKLEARAAKVLDRQGSEVLPGQRRRRGGRARERESVSRLADHPADVHRPRGARPVHDHPGDPHARAGHLRAGGAPEAGARRRGTGQRPRRRRPGAHVHPVGAGQLLDRRGRRRERRRDLAGTSSTGRTTTIRT